MIDPEVAAIVAAVEAALPKPVQHRLFEGVPLTRDDIRRLNSPMIRAKHRLADPPSDEEGAAG